MEKIRRSKPKVFAELYYKKYQLVVEIIKYYALTGTEHLLR